ncbi:MAG: hypothetical protein WDM78_10280 [Puia sp.]
MVTVIGSQAIIGIRNETRISRVCQEGLVKPLRKMKILGIQQINASNLEEENH